MSNTIKYSEGSESLALNKGNWWIGTGDTNKGPSDVTGYYAGVTPPSSGYTIYIKREDNLPSIFVAQNDQELINLTNLITESNFSTVQQCLVYYQTQDDMMCVNREYENIVTDGLVLNLDAGYVPSYPTSGTTLYDVSGNGKNGTLTNGPTFSGGSLVFDGVDDYIQHDFIYFPFTESYTVSQWQYKPAGSGTVWQAFTGYERYYGGSTNYSGYFMWHSGGGFTWYQSFDGSTYYGVTTKSLTTAPTVWGIVGFDTWYQVDVTYNGPSNLMKVYINGVEEISTTPSLAPGTDRMTFRYVNKGSQRYFEGNTANEMIYNRVLTQTEILQNYNAQKGRFGL